MFVYVVCAIVMVLAVTLWFANADGGLESSVALPATGLVIVFMLACAWVQGTLAETKAVQLGLAHYSEKDGSLIWNDKNVEYIFKYRALLIGPLTMNDPSLVKKSDSK